MNSMETFKQGVSWFSNLKNDHNCFSITLRQLRICFVKTI